MSYEYTHEQRAGKSTCSTLRARELFSGKKVTVIGLGLHGGGLESARFFADAGAQLTVTDMRDEKTLSPSVTALQGRNIRYVLGRHDIADFSGADIIIKNPAVAPDSPYLAAARAHNVAIETDISIFLRLCASPVIAVTGSKGKSSTASAIHHGFMASGVESLLGGNITVSPLTFVDKTAKERPVVLELSSWQLADMRGMRVLKPNVALLTAIMPDHMNRYSSMEEYVADKRLIYANQDKSDYTLCDIDQPWGREFAAETPGTPVGYSMNSVQLLRELVPETLLVPGAHMRKNLLAAGLALRYMGLSDAQIRAAAASFPGVEHRLELFAEKSGVQWYNDSASTIPQATAAALGSFSKPPILVAGGTDKNIDFAPEIEAYRKATRIILMAGSGSDKLIALLRKAGIAYDGPFDALPPIIELAKSCAVPGDVVLFSPGCTSFGMFLHEFDRGMRWKTAVRQALGEDCANSAKDTGTSCR